MKSPLATKEILSPNYGNYIEAERRWDAFRNQPITKFTPHHAAVVAPAENVANGFTYVEREASANYVIDSDGTIILCVPEEYRAWTSGNVANDNMAITVEVCNSTGEPEWRVSDKALEALINLGVDICRRYNLPGFNWTGNKNGTLTIHKMFQATACPGPYLESKMPYIAAEITKRLNTKPTEDVWYKVQVGAFRNRSGAENLLADLKAKGYNGFIVEVANVAESKPTITEGSTVKVKSGARDYNGGGLADFVYTQKYKVKEIKGDRAVITTSNGVVIAAVKTSDLILV